MNYQKVSIFGIIALMVFAIVVANYDKLRPYQWQWASSPDSSFKVMLPGKPFLREFPQLHAIEAKPTKQVGYSCGWWDDPSLSAQSEEKVLDYARDNAIRSVRGQFISENRLLIQGHPARDVQAWTHGAAMNNRLVMVGSRIYTLMVIDTSGKRDQKNIDKFFDSFTLLN